MNTMWDKENPAGDYIPYTEQITPEIVKTDAGDYIAVLKVVGISHESTDLEDIVLWKEQLNNLWRNISAPDLCFYVTTIRSLSNDYPKGSFQNTFCSRYNEAYKHHMQKIKMRKNDLYVTLVYRPNSNRINKTANGILSKVWSGSKFFIGAFGIRFQNDDAEEKKFYQDKQLEAIEKLNEYISIVNAALKKYSPTVLSTYEYNNSEYSEILEFLGSLVNGEWQRIPLPKGKIKYFLPTSRIFFGSDTAEIRYPDKDKKYTACLSFKEYCMNSAAGYLNALLSSPFDFILTESFVPKQKPIAIAEMQRAQRKMINAGEVAQSLVEELDEALDDVSAGRIVMGEHHISLFIFSDSHKELKNNLAIARSDLIDLSIIVAREDLALEAAWWAQLPANFRYRPRPALITSKNFAGLASLHNFPSGRYDGNQWGNCVTLFRTNSGTPYYFNAHEAITRRKKKGEDEKSQQKALANTLIIGPSGSGKTVAQAHIMLQNEKFEPTTFVFDKDRGLEILVKRIGGFYTPIMRGENTGFNPFSLDNTPENIQFLERFIKQLVKTDKYTPSIVEEKEITDAIIDIMQMPVNRRSLSSLLSYFTSAKVDGLYAHLSKWCKFTREKKEGHLAWVFDSGEPDKLDLSTFRIFGFDVTEFLDDEELRTPIVMYLFHRMEKLIDGRRFICYLDEFWKMLLDPYFEDFAQNKLKTIRKQNGYLVFGTQSPKDVLSSPISHSIIEQSPTQIYMGNDKASKEDYVDGFKLTNREYEIIKYELMPRQFLVKQSGRSVIVELNLQGFDDYLSIMSGTTDNIHLLDSIIADIGNNPEDWEPEFHRRRNSF